MNSEIKSSTVRAMEGEKLGYQQLKKLFTLKNTSNILPIETMKDSCCAFDRFYDEKRNKIKYNSS